MASITKWTPFGVAINLTANAVSVARISATQYTVKIGVTWETYYNGAQTNYGMSASSGGSSVIINNFGTIAGAGSGSLTGTYSISGNGSSIQTVTVTFRNYNEDNGNSATKIINLSVTVPAWAAYTVTYNANGGIGAPTSQTKWEGQTLTLSSVKPTRTGYSFQGWNASPSATDAGYAAGGTYKTDASITLYAVWKADTYTVTYNANGGTLPSGLSSQTKVYGVALVLSDKEPFLENYTFKGWGVSSNSTVVSYTAGGSYTTNAAVTLYAIWERSYTKPRINNLSVARCNSSGYPSTDGTYALVKFSWACDKTLSSIKITWGNTNSVSVDATGTSGSVSQVVGDNAFDIATSYTLKVTVTDSTGSTEKTARLVSMKLTIHGRELGNGIAFGKISEAENCVDMGWDLEMNDRNFLRNGIPMYMPFTKLTDIGITTFPTTMKTVAESMPNNSMLMLDDQDITAGRPHEISDLGIAYYGMYIFIRGNSTKRLSLLHIYGGSAADTAYITYGSYASQTDKVVWGRGEIYDATYPNCYYRMNTSGNKEWINPPMVAGVEYLTPERYNGKPVYAKLVEYGAMPNTTSKNVQHATSVNQKIIYLQGILTNAVTFSSGYNYSRTDPVGKFWVDTTHWSIRIMTESDMSIVTATILVKYTKEES